MHSVPFTAGSRHGVDREVLSSLTGSLQEDSAKTPSLGRSKGSFHGHAHAAHQGRTTQKGTNYCY